MSDSQKVFDAITAGDLDQLKRLIHDDKTLPKAVMGLGFEH